MLTPKQYINRALKLHPTLYVGKGTSYEEARMKVLDQLLNTNGNGIRDNEELEYELKNHGDIVENFDPRWFEYDVVYGYKNVKEFQQFVFPMFSDDDVTCFEYEKDCHPDVKHWLESTVYPFNPYPNFDKEYSTIYQCPDFLNLGDEWIQEAIDFYEHCYMWLMENENKYSYAFPKATEKETLRTIEDFKQCISRYDSYDAVTEAYGTEYNGNVYDFIERRWIKEKARIFEFIEETIALLKGKLTNV